MLSLILGLASACAWAVHDLLVRKIGQNAALMPMMLLVLGAGVLALILPALAFGNWSEMTPAAFVLAAFAGAAYVVGMGGLYLAFSVAPVRLVAPILGAIPMLSLGIAALEGKLVSALEGVAVLAIVGGIIVVAVTSREGEDTPRPGLAIGAAIVGACGFALTYWLSQTAVRQGDALPVILVARICTFSLLSATALAARLPLRPDNANIRVLIGMGLLDALALGLVTASGNMPNPEYASISSSLFGVLTILLAFWFLKERVSAVQWLGILTVFAGVALLSWQG
jgi:drug/metabolite transporter (DMT)-like permease